jgi:hypothetical protein
MCIPYTSELNDAPLMRHHDEGDYYAKICKAQFDQLYREGAENGRLMCIAVHPYVMGRPRRVKYLAEVLDLATARIHHHDGRCEGPALLGL